MLEEIIKQIEDSYYWDARVKTLECNYFGDEVNLEFEDEKKSIIYHFEECYKIKIEHAFEYRKNIPSKELKVTQIPYFMQNVELNEITEDKTQYMEFKINMYPIELYIVCKQFNIIQFDVVKRGMKEIYIFGSQEM